MPAPLIGITVDNRERHAATGKYESSIAYSRAVAEAGGMPVLLPHEPGLAEGYVRTCRALLLTGGDDPAMEAYGETTDARARVIDPTRQAFEQALLQATKRRPDRPVLGACLGMQLMALEAGGRLDQHLPDTLADAEVHAEDRLHPLAFAVNDSVLPPAEGEVRSRHHQAVREAGRLRVVATAPDGTIEAVDDPARRCYLGVQWHPERGGPGPLNRGLIRELVRIAGRGSG